MMSNKSTFAKIAVICGIILAAGLVLAGIGYALGGRNGIDKMAEKHDWIRTSSGERTVTEESVKGFDSVEVTGDIYDVFIVSEKYYSDPAWLDDMNILEESEAGKAGAGKVIVARGEKLNAPKISTEGNVLKIETNEKGFTGLNLELNSKTPVILVCCPEEDLKTIDVKVDTGDIVLGGITFEKASLNSDTGDVALNRVKGKNPTITCDTGDVALNAELTGNILIKTDTGDVEYHTAAGLQDLTVDLTADTGDIVVSEGGEIIAEDDDVPASYSRTGGRDNLTIISDTGDITLSCLEK